MLPGENAAYFSYPSHTFPHTYLILCPSTHNRDKMCQDSLASHPSENTATQTPGLPLRVGSEVRLPLSAAAKLVGLWKLSFTGLEAEPPESTVLRGRRGAGLLLLKTQQAAQRIQQSHKWHSSAPNANSQTEEAVHCWPPHSHALAPSLSAQKQKIPI